MSDRYDESDRAFAERRRRVGESEPEPPLHSYCGFCGKAVSSARFCSPECEQSAVTPRGAVAKIARPGLVRTPALRSRLAPVLIDDCRCAKKTDRALLVETPALVSPMWVPRSQIMPESDLKDVGDTGTLAISKWFARKVGIIE